MSRLTRNPLNHFQADPICGAQLAPFSAFISLMALSLRLLIRNCKLPALIRAFQWTSCKDLWDHVDSHMGVAGWPDLCPRFLCQQVIQSAEAFDYHMVDVHGEAKNSCRNTAPEKNEHQINIDTDILCSLGTTRMPRQHRQNTLYKLEKTPIPGLSRFSLRPRSKVKLEV